MIDWAPETAYLREQIGRTRVAAAARAAARAVSSAWAGASARRAWMHTVATIDAASPQERVRAVGICAVTAAITDGVLTPFDPRPATMVRWALWIGLLVLGATAAAFAGPVATAWGGWHARRPR